MMNVQYLVSIRRIILVLLSTGLVFNMHYCAIMAFTPSTVTHHKKYSVTFPKTMTSHPSHHNSFHRYQYLVKSNRDDQNEKVKVNIIPDVDPVTLTAIGFALIAFNFLVFANLGDGGIGSFVARMINTYN